MTQLAVVIISLIVAGCSSTNNLEPLLSADSIEVTQGRIDPTGGKPGAPIVLNYQMPKTIDIGEDISIELELSSLTKSGTLKIDLNADTGLILQAGVTETFELDGKTSHRLMVPVYTSTEGLFYVNIIASETDLNGQPMMARAFAVAVKVGSGADKKPEHELMIKDASGESIIQMPAEEEIKR